MTRKDQVPSDASRGRPRDARVDAAILDAALELFARGGMDAVTFDGVAARAGVSRSGVYRRWRSREDLVVGALLRHRQHGEQGAEGWASTGSVSAVMAVFRDRAVTSLCDPRSLGLLGHVLALDVGSPVRQSYWTTVVAPRREQLSRMIVEGRERGELPGGPDPDVLQDLLAGALAYRALAHPEPLDESAAGRYVDGVLEALGLGDRPPADPTSP